MGIEGKGGADMRTITKEMAVAALKELERELALRKNVYHRLIRDGKLTPKAARKQTESLRDALLIVKDWLESRGIIHAAQSKLPGRGLR